MPTPCTFPGIKFLANFTNFSNLNEYTMVQPNVISHLDS